MRLSDPGTRDEVTLYRLLVVAAPETASPGETLTTRQKETIDNDVEVFNLEAAILDNASPAQRRRLGHADPLRSLGEPAPDQGAPGETAVTATKETIDNDREDLVEVHRLLGS